MKLEWKTCFKAAFSCFVLFLAIYYWKALAGFASSILNAASSLLIGCILAYALNLLMSFYERCYFPGKSSDFIEKSRRPVCLVAAIITLIGLVAALISIVIPELVACVSLLLSEIPDAIDMAVDWIQDSGILYSSAVENVFASLENINWEEKIAQMVQILLEGVGGAAQVAFSTVSSIVSFVATVLISSIFALYILASKEKLGRQFTKLAVRYLRPDWYVKLRYVINTLNNCFHKFIVGQCTEAVILGMLCILGMSILRFPYAMMIGTLIGFTALVPIAGAYIGAIVGAFMILTVSPIKALGFLIFLVILQQLEGNLIYPKVVGGSIGLPGIWVLAAVTIGGGIAGIGGMLIGVPLAATAYQLLKADVNRPRRKRMQYPEPKAPEK